MDVLPCVHVNLDDRRFHDLKIQLEKDYYSICNQLNEHIKTKSDGFIHTSNGEYIQIRSKDSKPYHAIYSDIYKKKFPIKIMLSTLKRNSWNILWI